MPENKKWIWEDVGYPHFQYDFKKLEILLASISRKQGELTALSQVISQKNLQESQLHALEEEIVSSSAIENEILDRESVKSSIREKLGFEPSEHYRQKTKESDFVDILIDVNSNHEDPLSLGKLFDWHKKMFDNSNNILWNIKVGQFRQKGTMQIVSGVIGKEKVYYEAPPYDTVNEEMNAYISWFNSTPSSLLKVSIAHLWFVIIHPFDDGNGRITRAISDMVLSNIENSTTRLYSLSKSINQDRKGYYKALENSTGYIIKTEPMDITLWCEWFLSTVEKSLIEAISSIVYIVIKAKFWDRHRETPFNERQRRVLNMMLDKDIKNNENYLTSKKYKKMANTTAPTASRDIKSLLDFGCIVQVVGSGGRNIRYEMMVR